LLPTAVGWVSRDDMSNPEVEGTVLIGVSELDGAEEMDPYAEFRSMAPMEKISGTVLAFHGRFALRHAFAVSQINHARSLAEAGHMTEAVEAARKAVAAAADQEPPHAELARDLAAAHQIDEARAEYQSAISLAQHSPTDYSQREAMQLEKELGALPLH
jgi:thioredoxin-like negative regulator of GroEL